MHPCHRQQRDCERQRRRCDDCISGITLPQARQQDRSEDGTQTDAASENSIAHGIREAIMENAVSPPAPRSLPVPRGIPQPRACSECHGEGSRGLQ